MAHRKYVRWTPHPVIVTIRDNRDNIRVLVYSYYTTITGWGGPPKKYYYRDGIINEESDAPSPSSAVSQACETSKIHIDCEQFLKWGHRVLGSRIVSRTAMI